MVLKNPFSLVWSREHAVVRGMAGAEWAEGSITYPVMFPGKKSEATVFTLRSSARDTHTFEVLKDVRLYLTGASVPVVQEIWPYLGTAARTDLRGGFELSFDDGWSWVRCSREQGYAPDPSTWIQIPATAIGLAATDGELGPFDVAHLMARYVVPPGVTDYQVLDIQLAVGFDIV